ncbi:hypothetical protein [Rathayibacter sp. SD072]|uniref:hypothetical protein n=1 Tax=Rathayibacter sp. SD072 TaxID=2781731 RepID=UPI001A969009|nr:hypothetical protein [Rathayibacter sp. SD072]MBO0984875.1 hypothetical protein [Rathayibacter sp. SD072]
MSDHNDADGGVHEDMDTAMRTALTVAMQLADKMARLRDDLARDAERRDTDAARELSARFEAERAVAMSQVDVVNRPEWWQDASVEDVARVAETAESWRGFDPRAAAAMETIGREVQERYGVDVSSLIADERARAGEERTEAVQLVAEADRLDRAADTRAQDGPESGQDVASGLEAQALAYEAAAARGGDEGRTPEELLGLAADARAQAQLHQDGPATDSSSASPSEPAADAARAESGVQYDSSERREAFAKSMEGKATPEEIAVRMRADVDQARPAHEAVLAKSTPSRGRGRGTPGGGRTPERGDRSR